MKKGLLLLCVLLTGCSQHAARFPDYSSFLNGYKSGPASITEMYGNYRAEQTGKKISARFNLLLQPGKRAYMEILDPSDRLMNVLSLSEGTISLLWSADNKYITEKASPQNLKAILGLPVAPDDALQLISGLGLNFSEWQQEKPLKDGWILTRETYRAKITAGNNISRIEISTNAGTFVARYDKYELMNERSRPARIRLELPGSRTHFELNIDRFVPRTEEPTDDLFAVQLPRDAHQFQLSEIYKGKPLILQ